MKVVFQLFLLFSILSSCGIHKTLKESDKYELEEKKYIESHYFEGEFDGQKYSIDIYDCQIAHFEGKIKMHDTVFKVKGIKKGNYFFCKQRINNHEIDLHFNIYNKNISCVDHAYKKQVLTEENRFICYAKEKKLILSKLNDSSYVFTTFSYYEDTKFSANGLIKICSDGIVLIDTPWDSTQFQPLLDEIKFRFDLPVKLVISTHSHIDRTNGLEYYSKIGIPTYTSRATYNICKERGEKHSEFTFRNDTTFFVGTTKIETFYPGAGHAPDNIVIWFPSDRVLFGGCFIKSTEAENIGNLADANVGMWPIALKAVKRKYKKPNFIIPGHQNWESLESINYTLKLLKKLGKEKEEEK